MPNTTPSARRLLHSNIFILLLSVAIGIAIGAILINQTENTHTTNWLRFILFLKQISGEIIFFLVPLIVLGFVAPSISSLRGNVTLTVLFAFILAYLSSVLAATMAAIVGYNVVPLLDIQPITTNIVTLPEPFFTLQIPPLFSVMSALLLAIMLGLGVIWIKADATARLLQEFQQIILILVKKILLPVLPIFIAVNFAIITYQKQLAGLRIFLSVIAIAILLHYVWLAILYLIASAYTRTDSRQVLKHYLPAYLTALGTMSSAATLGVSLNCIHRCTLVERRVADFGIPLFANIHLCGSVLTEVLFACVVSQLLYGHLPSPAALTTFILLLGILAIGAPGVPGGTVMASLGIVVSILGFDTSGTALIITIFALQDSFGTACNVTGDGALTLILNHFANKHHTQKTTPPSQTETTVNPQPTKHP